MKSSQDRVEPTVISAKDKNNLYIMENGDVVEVIGETEALVSYRTCLVNNFYRVMGIDSSQVDDYQFVRYVCFFCFILCFVQFSAFYSNFKKDLLQMREI